MVNKAGRARHRLHARLKSRVPCGEQKTRDANIEAEPYKRKHSVVRELEESGIPLTGSGAVSRAAPNAYVSGMSYSFSFRYSVRSPIPS